MFPDPTRRLLRQPSFFALKKLVLLIALLCLSGCSNNSQFLVHQYGHPSPSPQEYYVCHGYGCIQRSTIHLSEHDWQTIKAIFAHTAVSANQERKQIAQAIQKFESIAGKLIGTDADKPESPVLFFNPQQQDCIDETINTATYLNLLDQHQLLKFHKPGDAARRGFFIDGDWPHNTAVIIETESKQAYAVDSWFRANAEPPVIIPLELWRSGWRLGDSVS